MVILVIVLLALLSVYFLANRYLTSERIKSLVISPLEEATGLRVQIGEISRQGLLGVKVERILFLEPRTQEKVLSARELRLNLSLSPLLQGKLVVTEAAFISPEIHLIRFRDGTYNFQKFLGEGPAERPQKEARPSRLALVFQQIRIENARISFRDDKKEYPPAEALLNLLAQLKLSGGKLGIEGEGGIDLSVAQYPLAERVRFKVQTRAETVSFNLLGGAILSGKPSGEISLEENRLDGAITLEGISLEKAAILAQKLRPYFFPEAEIPGISGSMNLEISLGGTLKAPDYKALVFLNPLQAKLEGLEVITAGKIEATARAINPFLDLKLNGEPLSLKGKILLTSKIPQVDLDLYTPRLDLKALLPEEKTPASKEKASKKTRKPSSPEKKFALGAKGRIKFYGKEVCYELCGQDVRATLFLSPREVSLKELTLLLAGAVTQVSAKVSGLPERPALLFSYSLAGADISLLARKFLAESNYFTSGKVWTEGTFRGRGLEAEALKRTLSGEGQARFLNLGLKETPASRVVAGLLGMEELKKLTFEKGEAIFSIKGGWVDIKGKFSREGLEILLFGQLGLDGRLNLRPHLLFMGKMAENFRRRFPGASLFRTQKGYEVPLAITGTFEEPKVALAREVKEKIKEKAVEKIFNFLGR